MGELIRTSGGVVVTSPWRGLEKSSIVGVWKNKKPILLKRKAT
jgi:hypothetical protein